jgi:hypothetical protein
MHSSGALNTLTLIWDNVPVFFIWAVAVGILMLGVIAFIGSNLIHLRFATASVTILFLLPFYILSFGRNFRLDTWTAVFMAAFLFRCTGILVHMISSLAYQPREIASKVYSPGDVTVVLPTVCPEDPGFRECVSTILRNKPHTILVVTVGAKLRRQCLKIIGTLITLGHSTIAKVGSVDKASKRRQIAHALRNVETRATVLVGDRCCWVNDEFLSSLLAAMDGERVSVVMTRQNVRRGASHRFWSFVSVSSRIAGSYLEHWNWVLRAVNAVDGGVALIPGSTCALETKFLKDPLRLNRFCSERFFFGIFGGDGFDADGESFLIREALTAGLGVKYQDTGEALVETTFGQDWPSFFKQVLRWERSAFRSSPVYLKTAKFFNSYPWTYFMIHLAGLVDFTLFWDGILLYSLWKSDFSGNDHIAALMVWLIITKDISVITHFGKHPTDVWLLPLHILIAYFLSLVKLFALLTFYKSSWFGPEANTLGDDTPGGYHFSVVEVPGVMAAADEVTGRAVDDVGLLREPIVEQSRDKAAEKPEKDVVEQLVEHIVDQAVAQAIGGVAIEQAVEKAVDEISVVGGKVVNPPLERAVAEKPQEVAIEESVKHLQQVAFEQSAENIAEQLLEDAVEQHMENTVEQPAEQAIGQLEAEKPTTKRQRRRKKNKNKNKKKNATDS